MVWSRLWTSSWLWPPDDPRVWGTQEAWALCAWCHVVDQMHDAIWRPTHGKLRAQPPPVHSILLGSRRFGISSLSTSVVQAIDRNGRDEEAPRGIAGQPASGKQPGVGRNGGGDGLHGRGRLGNLCEGDSTQRATASQWSRSWTCTATTGSCGAGWYDCGLIELAAFGVRGCCTAGGTRALWTTWGQRAGDGWWAHRRHPQALLGSIARCFRRARHRRAGCWRGDCL